MSLIQLKRDRADHIERARRIMERAEREGRTPNSEERAEFDRRLAEAARLKTDADRAEADDLRQLRADAIGAYSPRRFFADPKEAERYNHMRAVCSTPQYRQLFLRYLMARPAERDLVPEFRDTILATDTKGGYLAAPTILASEVDQILESTFEVGRLATRVTLATDSIQWAGNENGLGKGIRIPYVSVLPADCDWTAETTAATEDTTMALVGRDLSPTLLSKLCKASRRFIYGVADSDVFIARMLGYKFAATQEKYFIIGSGSSQPLGVFTASANGIPTGQDVSTGNTTTAIGAQNIYEMKYSLKAPYRQDPSCRWLWSAAAMKMIMLLKDSSNRYLWEPSGIPGQPDMLAGIGVIESAYVPATFTTGLYVGALGAFRHYYVGQADVLQIQTLLEKYAATNEVGFIGRMFVDGAPVVGEAFCRSKLA